VSENEDGPTCEELAGSLDDWPNCRTPDCENKACLSVGSRDCFPCTATQALFHQTARNHDYNPRGCSACAMAAKLLNLKGF
jgi:hypothetical protein